MLPSPILGRPKEIRDDIAAQPSPAKPTNLEPGPAGPETCPYPLLRPVLHHWDWWADTADLTENTETLMLPFSIISKPSTHIHSVVPTITDCVYLQKKFIHHYINFCNSVPSNTLSSWRPSDTSNFPPDFFILLLFDTYFNGNFSSFFAVSFIVPFPDSTDSSQLNPRISKP